ncbi:hypothetical protein M378DRAFT_423544 [Amanita muscaria Koide BX008]|uniref:Uncharacterized protein n=1 Tax=Amanita muscaria (strain Koide BX008) TaxID=946122 RepID=A0A0C2WJW0_AMAMK|nr:hypothetical protein M378DRAFT_423544 [Amanita muscaria Koide BX008]
MSDPRAYTKDRSVPSSRPKFKPRPNIRVSELAGFVAVMKGDAPIEGSMFSHHVSILLTFVRYQEDVV